MSHGIFGYLVGILIFYVVLGLILTAAGEFIVSDDEYTTGLQDTEFNASSQYAGANFMLNIWNVLGCSIPGIPRWIQIGLFGTLDVILAIIVAFWARGISS